MYSIPALFILGKYKGCSECKAFISPLFLVDNIDMSW